MGHDNIGLILKMTNHWVLKTSVERLLNSRFDSTIVAQHSGHKNVASINKYAVASGLKLIDFHIPFLLVNNF